MKEKILSKVLLALAVICYIMALCDIGDLPLHYLIFNMVMALCGIFFTYLSFLVYPDTFDCVSGTDDYYEEEQPQHTSEYAEIDVEPISDWEKTYLEALESQNQKGA